MYLSMCHICSM